MNKKQLLLAAMAAGPKSEFDPVQIQKLVFLIERKIGNHIGGPVFDFQPYHYGPFDVVVYNTLDQLSDEGYVAIDRSGSVRRYQLTSLGQRTGQEVLTDLSELVSKYIAELAEFVQRLSFKQLVSAVYKAYPDMRANSVFQD